MSKFGSKTLSDGKEIKADGKTAVIVGERVLDNTFIGAKMIDINERPVLEVSFKQSNGAVFKHNFFKPEEDKDYQLDNLNRAMVHMATKWMKESDYYTAVSNADSFEDFCHKLLNKVFPIALNKKFNLKITYRISEKEGETYFNPQFPQFPNFIEKGDTEFSTFSSNPEYDFYERIVPKKIKKKDELESEDSEEIDNIDFSIGDNSSIDNEFL